ncbi:YgjV family protein [Cloacibacillus porcorum]|nr:YgjV family protein [Cloacibacillus porcorum]
MDCHYILAQAIGFGGAAMLIGAYQCKTSHRLFGMQICGHLLYIIHFLCWEPSPARRPFLSRCCAASFSSTLKNAGPAARFGCGFLSGSLPPAVLQPGWTHSACCPAPR